MIDLIEEASEKVLAVEEKMATLEITTRVGCKNNCRYCPQGALVEAYKKRSSIYEMSLDTFKRCLDKVPKEVRIDFSGMAEPWLNPVCTEMVVHAHDAGFSLAVYTTLVGMNLVDIDALTKIPFRVFEVHLPDQDSYTNIKVTGEYLEKLKKISNSNISGLGYMTIGKVHPAVKEVVSEKVKEHPIIDRAGNVKEIEGVQSNERLKGIIRCISCGKLLNHNVMLPNGDIILCCMDYGLKHVLGNLLEVDYEKLFHTSGYRLLQRKLNDDSLDILCRYCHNAKRSKWNWLHLS